MMLSTEHSIICCRSKSKNLLKKWYTCLWLLPLLCQIIACFRFIALRMVIILIYPSVLMTLFLRHLDFLQNLRCGIKASLFPYIILFSIIMLLVNLYVSSYFYSTYYSTNFSLFVSFYAEIFRFICGYTILKTHIRHLQINI